MDYNTLNEINKGKMRGTCNNDEHFEWEDSEFLEIMKGRLPKTRNYSYNSEVQSLYSKLSSLCDKYDFFNVDQVACCNMCTSLSSFTSLRSLRMTQTEAFAKCTKIG